MSTIGRTGLIQAFNGIEQLNIADAMPTPVAYSGWLEWERATRCAYGSLEHTWSLYVILPAADSAATIDAADPLIGDLVTVAEDLASVTEMTPVVVAFDEAGATMPALKLTFSTMYDYA